MGFTSEFKKLNNDALFNVKWLCDMTVEHLQEQRARAELKRQRTELILLKDDQAVAESIREECAKELRRRRATERK